MNNTTIEPMNQDEEIVNIEDDEMVMRRDEIATINNTTRASTFESMNQDEEIINIEDDEMIMRRDSKDRIGNHISHIHRFDQIIYKITLYKSERDINEKFTKIIKAIEGFNFLNTTRPVFSDSTIDIRLRFKFTVSYAYAVLNSCQYINPYSRKGTIKRIFDDIMTGNIDEIDSFFEKLCLQYKDHGPLNFTEELIIDPDLKFEINL